MSEIKVALKKKAYEVLLDLKSMNILQIEEFTEMLLYMAKSNSSMNEKNDDRFKGFVKGEYYWTGTDYEKKYREESKKDGFNGLFVKDIVTIDSKGPEMIIVAIGSPEEGCMTFHCEWNDEKGKTRAGKFKASCLTFLHPGPPR